MPANPPPPNPFESPQAVDSVTTSDKWRPRWREVMLGLALTPLATPTVLGATVIITNRLLLHIPSASGFRLPDFTLGSFTSFLLPVYIAAVIFVFPIFGIAWRFYKLSTRSVLMLGLAVGALISSLLIAELYQSMPTGETYPDLEFLFSMPHLFLAIVSSFATFALYLAHLRRRDLRRIAPSV